LHYHDTDRARANHTGTQLASTISDFASAVNTEVWQDTNFIDSSTINFTATAGVSITASVIEAALGITLSQVTDVTATAAEVNLLDLAGLTVGWVLSADSSTTASWKAPTGVWTVVTDATASRTAADGEYVLINAATFDLTLPAASADARIGCKMINGTVTDVEVITTGTETIDGTDYDPGTGLAISNQWDALTFVSDGTNWFIEA
jgi:hypothetical protein